MLHHIIQYLLRHSIKDNLFIIINFGELAFKPKASIKLAGFIKAVDLGFQRFNKAYLGDSVAAKAYIFSSN